MSEKINPDRLYRRPMVEEFTGFGRSSIYRGILEGWFPAPVKIGPRAVAWRGADLITWMNSREQTAA